MASTSRGAAVTAAKQRSQLRLARAAQAQAVLLWRMLHPDMLDADMPSWIAAQLQAVIAVRRAAALDAARHYDRYRLAESGGRMPSRPGIVTVGGVPVPADSMTTAHDTTERIITSLRVTGPVRVKQSRARGRTADQAMADGLAAVQGTVQRHVLDGGRNAEMTLMHADPEVFRYARVTDGNACAFCGMLASRGAVYLSQESAGFDTHDHCGCGVEPVIESSTWTPPAGTQTWQTRWHQYGSGIEGRPSAAGFAKWLRTQQAA